MNTLMQSLATISALPLLVLGIRSMFAPRGMSTPFSITPRGNAGLSTIRSVAGGLFFACVAMITLGLLGGQTLWLMAVAIVMIAVAAGRVVGLLVDGFERAVVPPLAVELVLATILATTHLTAN